ncbi:hypothetical protein [Nonomuraea sp. NPDC049309]
MPVRRTDSGGAASLANPAEAAFSSLRATVTGADGNGVTRTVIRAYAAG